MNSALQHLDYSNIFVAGDAAGTRYPVSKQAYYALDMGKTAALNIIRHRSGKRLKDFKPSSKPMLVSFGDLDAFLIDKKFVIAGPAIRMLKESVFQLVMAELDPSSIFQKSIHSAERIGTSAIKTASTMSVSLSSLAKIGKLRIIN